MKYLSIAVLALIGEIERVEAYKLMRVA